MEHRCVYKYSAGRADTNHNFVGNVHNDSTTKLFSAKQAAMSRDTTYETSNYPPSNDCEFVRYVSHDRPRAKHGAATSSGGYGSSQNPYSDTKQRGRPEDSSGGLIDQSVTGGPIGEQIQDAKQGKDASTREEFAREAKRDFGVEGSKGLNPYGEHPDTRKKASDMLASQYTDMRGRDFETGASMEDA